MNDYQINYSYFTENGRYIPVIFYCKLKNANNCQQISNIAENSYRTEGTGANALETKENQFSYDTNGNLLSINTGTKQGDKLKVTNTRKLLWDEENHLLASCDNGYVTGYFYDAAGERTVKMSGDAEGVFVNGLLSGGRTGTDNFTAYLSPYLNVRNGGEYTKHIYMGSQRITSKVSDSGIFKPENNPVKDTLQSKYTAQTAALKMRYDSLGVQYKGVEKSGSIVSSSSSGLSASYFYHSDHLGSSSLITDVSGDIVQHVEYVPFGGTFIDERRSLSSWHTPFLFSGKERDEETGLLYVSQRYQDEKYGIWYSVDQLAEKYPNISSYVYCANNPVKYVDPDGRVLFLVNGYDGFSKTTKDPTNIKDLAQMTKYWTKENPQFIKQVMSRFNETHANLVDGSQGGFSHGDVKVRYDRGYQYAVQLVLEGTVDFSSPINILGHSMGCAEVNGMADAFLAANPKAVINILLLAPDGAEKFSLDKRTNSAQFTYSDDGVVTNNIAIVGNVDVNLNPTQAQYSPFLSNSLKKLLNSHSALIDNPNAASGILNNKKTIELFKIIKDE